MMRWEGKSTRGREAPTLALRAGRGWGVAEGEGTWERWGHCCGGSRKGCWEATRWGCWRATRQAAGERGEAAERPRREGGPWGCWRSGLGCLAAGAMRLEEGASSWEEASSRAESQAAG